MTGTADPEDAASARILVVDDEPGVRRALVRVLARAGHAVHAAGSVPEARAALRRRGYDVVVTDLRMPGASGLELLRDVLRRDAGTRTILISGDAGTGDAADAIECGVDFLLLKPFSLDDLVLKVGQALERRRASERAGRERALLEARVRRRDAESGRWILRAVHALAAAVEAKDAYTAGHAARVTAYALAIAGETGGLDRARFRLAGDLHDVGKIGVPDRVLNKPGALTEEERALVRQHPVTGVTILTPLIDDPLILTVVRSHHERWDGTGYPDELSGEAIPFGARVLAVTDTLDAMVSSRAYRDALPWEHAVAEVLRCSGTQFDPRVVGAFERALPRLAAIFRSTDARRPAAAVPARSPGTEVSTP